MIVLIQKGKGGGLAAAFGGGGGSTAFGTKTGDVFTGITVGLAAVFLLLTVLGNYVFKPQLTPGPAVVQSAPGSATPGAAGGAAPPPISPDNLPAGAVPMRGMACVAK